MSEQLAQRIEPIQAPVSPVDEVKGEKSPEVQVSETSEKPPTLLSAEGKPLLAELLQINDDHFNIPEDTKYLDSFILSEIKRQSLMDNKKSYQSVLDYLIEKTNIPKGLDIYSKLERLSEYAKIQQRLYGIIEERDNLLKRDVSDMTSKELLKYIEIKNDKS